MGTQRSEDTGVLLLQTRGVSWAGSQTLGTLCGANQILPVQVHWGARGTCSTTFHEEGRFFLPALSQGKYGALRAEGAAGLGALLATLVVHEATRRLLRSRLSLGAVDGAVAHSGETSRYHHLHCHWALAWHPSRGGPDPWGSGLASRHWHPWSPHWEKRKLLTGRWPYTGYEAGGVDRPLYKLGAKALLSHPGAFLSVIGCSPPPPPR